MTAPAQYADPTSPPDSRPASTTRSGRLRRWQPWALLAICLLAALLYGWNLNGSWGNDFYTAAVKSMTTSFTNFLFGSFDPAGVVTVDKPPAALWADALSVLIFGFHKWSVALPQALEGVAAVFLLHRTVRRWAGENVALLAALILTLTPITVAIDRVDNPDALLVLFLVAAAYSLTRAMENGIGPRSRTKWLLWCAFFIGCGFTTKMLAAWIVVPGFAVAYLLASTSSWKRRVFDLLGATGVLLVSSFWWPLLHDLWPGSKPYMDNSADGTAFNLIFVYNGFSRVFGGDSPGGSGGGGFTGNGQISGEFQRLAQEFGGAQPGGGSQPGGGGGGGMGSMFGGSAGITRMFADSVGAQISWLLPLALLLLLGAAVAGVLRMRAKQAGNPAWRGGWWMWGSWLIVTGLVFSFSQGIFHPYYTTALAPAIAAICAAGLAVLWRRYRTPGGATWWLLPAGVAVTAIWAYVLVERTPTWNGWAGPAVLAVGGVAVLVLVVVRLVGRARTGEINSETSAGIGGRRLAFGRSGLVLGVVAILLVPTVWSAGTALSKTSNSSIPTAGPSGTGFGGFGGAGGTGAARQDLPGGFGGSGGATPEADRNRSTRGGGGFGGGGGMGGDGTLTAEEQKILAYAVKNSPNARIKLAVAGSSMTAAPFIINSDDTVIGMGGFEGADNAPSVSQLAQWVSSGQLRYVLLTNGGGFGGGNAGGGTAGGAGGNAGAGGGFPGGAGGSGGGSVGGPGGGSGGGSGSTNYSEQRTQWVEQHCTAVDAGHYGGTTTSSTGGSNTSGAASELPDGLGTIADEMGFGEQTLYDCA